MYVGAHCSTREYEAGVGADVEIVYSGGGNNNTNLNHNSNSSLRQSSCGLDAENIAQLARMRVHRGLRRSSQRSDKILEVCLFVAGMVQSQPKLFWIDQYAALESLEYGAHGYASNFVLSILDRGFRKDMSKEDAIELMKDCFRQLRIRYLINCPEEPCIKCIDKNGCKLCE